MPRLPRVHLEGVLYYVTARAVAGQPLFQDDRDYETYLGLLEHYRRQYGFTLFSYCLLPDHLHLCVELSPNGTISAIMHDLTSRYTKYANKRYARSGHLFQDRFRSVIVEKDPYLLSVTAYIHTHPLRSKLVSDIAGYRFSSYPQYLSSGQWAAGPDMTTAVQDALARLPQGGSAEGYARYVTEFQAGGMTAFREQLQQRILGSEPFVEMIRARLASDPVEPKPAPAPPPAPNAGWRAGMPRRAVRSPAWAAAMAGLVMIFGLGAFAVVQQMMGGGQTVVLIAPGNRTTLPAQVAMAVHGGLSQELDTLRGSEWEIQVIPLQATGPAAASRDRLTFTQTQVFSKTLTDDGYPSSKYLVSRSPDGRLAWETIQTNRKGVIVSWEGEWQGTVMRGTMQRQRSGFPPERFSFVGVLKQDAETSVRSET